MIGKPWRYWWYGRTLYKVNPNASYPVAAKDWPWAMWWRERH